MEHIEEILRAPNLTQASKGVIRNQGAGGRDRISVRDLEEYLKNNRESLVNQIRNQKYILLPIRGKEIPKGNGRFRTLGIPTVVDRMLQQAVSRVMMPGYEYMFSKYSYECGIKRFFVAKLCVVAFGLDSIIIIRYFL